MPMKTGPEVLALLRTGPSIAVAAWGFIVRGACLGAAAGGGATLTCAHEDGGVYRIAVTIGGPDFYIPFGQSEARYCDVPSGQGDGALVVTYPMNGCALEVRATATGNRFYHDSDGRSMGAVAGVQKLRADYSSMRGAERQRAEEVFGRARTGMVGQNFEHSIFCIKSGTRWKVYSSTVVTFMSTRTGARECWQIKDYVPYELGEFDD